MNPIKKKMITGSVIAASLFAGIWSLFCVLKDIKWPHPLIVIFIPLWTILVVWITQSTIKKYYKQRAAFFMDAPQSSELYTEKQSKWRHYLKTILNKYLGYSVIVSFFLALFYGLKMIVGDENWEGVQIQIIFWVIVALLSLILSKIIQIKKQ